MAYGRFITHQCSCCRMISRARPQHPFFSYTQPCNWATRSAHLDASSYSQVSSLSRSPPRHARSTRDIAMSASTSSQPPQVLTIGFGALGTLYSFILQAAGAQVTAVARSNYEVVSKHGITVNSGKFGNFESWKPTRVINDPETARDRVYDCEQLSSHLRSGN